MLQIKPRQKINIEKHKNKQPVMTKTDFMSFSDQTGRKTQVKFQCVCLTGVNDSDWGHSVKVCIVGENPLDSLEDVSAEFANDSGLDYREFVKEGKFYLKLKIASDANGVLMYSTNIVPKADPENLFDSPIQEGKTLVVTATPSVWVNYEGNSVGMFLNLESIEIEQKPTRSRS